MFLLARLLRAPDSFANNFLSVWPVVRSAYFSKITRTTCSRAHSKTLDIQRNSALATPNAGTQEAGRVHCSRRSDRGVEAVLQPGELAYVPTEAQQPRDLPYQWSRPHQVT